MKVAFTMAVEGAAFAGTALQPGRPTLHGRLRELLAAMHGGAECLTRSSGRLDAGVSAEGLVVHAILPKDWEPRELARALNAQMRGVAVIHRVAAVEDAWDALAASSRKTYRYVVHEGGAPPPPGVHAWHQRSLPHSHLLPHCTAALVGHHDLAAFAALRGDGSDPADARRRYTHADWRAAPVPGGTRWMFRITGEGFLYKQVRGLVGALVAVAQGRTAPEDFIGAIDAGSDHPKQGPVAPAEPLILEAVTYDEEPLWRAV